MSEEYIKRADVVKLLDDTWVDGTEYMGYLHGDLEKIQTTDVVEVVRCKDCKYRQKEWYQDKRKKDGGYWIIGCGNFAIAERVYGLAQDNDFCSYGERADT